MGGGRRMARSSTWTARRVQPTDRQELAWNGHFSCSCYHPLFSSTVRRSGALCLAARQPHSAQGWRALLEPVVARYRERGLDLYFRDFTGLRWLPNTPNRGILTMQLSPSEESLSRGSIGFNDLSGHTECQRCRHARDDGGRTGHVAAPNRTGRRLNSAAGAVVGRGKTRLLPAAPLDGTSAPTRGKAAHSAVLGLPHGAR